jgi:hypothetical protein
MWEKAVCEEGSVEASGIEGGREEVVQDLNALDLEGRGGVEYSR